MPFNVDYISIITFTTLGEQKDDKHEGGKRT